MTALREYEHRGRHATAPGSGVVMVNEGYCINVRGRIDACDLCQRICHAAAITLSTDGAVVDPDRCTECGACVPECPAGAFTHSAFDPEELVRSAAGKAYCRIACTGASDREAARIPCHKMLDARLMAALFAEGVEAIESVGIECCGSCPSGDARPALRTAVRTLAKWFGEAAPKVKIAPCDRAAGDNPAVRRRALLRRTIRSLALPPAPSFDELVGLGDSENAAAARPVPYQAALASRRHRLPFKDDSPVGATGRTIGESCSGCLVCAEFCPTGALEGDSSAHHRVISFDPALCTNCTLCLKICPMEAISARALRGVAAATAGRSVLFGRAERICAECGTHFAPAGDNRGLCSTCENEMELDAEWLEMLQN